MALQGSSLLLHPPNNQNSAFLRSCQPSVSPLFLARNYFSPRVLRSTSFQGCFAALNSDEIYQREEARWIREEQRWIREEDRWHREQQRWQAERISLQNEIQTLKSVLADIANTHPDLMDRLKASWIGGNFQEIQTAAALEAELVHRRLPTHPVPAIESANNSLVTSELQVTSYESSSSSDSNGKSGLSGISGSGSISSQASSSNNNMTAKELLDKVPAADIIAAVASRTVGGAKVPTPVAETPIEDKKTETAEKVRRSLSVGAEGDDVKEMQLMLASLGFYPGEDDLENDFFSEVTESAVKTWQATINVRENGVMSSELLAILYGEEDISSLPKLAVPQVSATSPSGNWAPAATREKREIERYARTDLEEGYSGRRRVYLLGENRWEEPDRMPAKGATAASVEANAALRKKACHGCRGEGSVVCLECEGTGDLNVEDQFLDWAGEEAKCLYCDGKGSTPCDSCGGSGQLAS